MEADADRRCTEDQANRDDYEAKRAGRNCVAFLADADETPRLLADGLITGATGVDAGAGRGTIAA